MKWTRRSATIKLSDRITEWATLEYVSDGYRIVKLAEGAYVPEYAGVNVLGERCARHLSEAKGVCEDHAKGVAQ